MPPVNNAPAIPILVYLTNNLLCIENLVKCWWNPSTDSDGDAITYQVEVARDNLFTQDKQTFNIQSTSQSVSLEEDANTSDTLSYDVCFGMDNPPAEMVSENQSVNTLTRNSTTSSTYYWKVVVKDRQGWESIG